MATVLQNRSPTNEAAIFYIRHPASVVPSLAKGGAVQANHRSHSHGLSLRPRRAIMSEAHSHQNRRRAEHLGNGERDQRTWRPMVAVCGADEMPVPRAQSSRRQGHRGACNGAATCLLSERHERRDSLAQTDLTANEGCLRTSLNDAGNGLDVS